MRSSRRTGTRWIGLGYVGKGEVHFTNLSYIEIGQIRTVLYLWKFEQNGNWNFIQH